ncbi:MAG: PorV/PorQ family protein [Ignavibacteriaceae bacterium]
MRKNSLVVVTLILTILLFSENSFSQNKKLGQAGLKFLSVSLDPRSSAMGDAVTSLSSNSIAQLYNPASMSEMSSMSDFAFGTTRWIADINYIYGTIGLNPWDGDYGTFGISMVAVDYGELIGTVVASNDDGYIEVGTFKPTALALGIGYAKSLSEKFAIGGNIKYVRQSLGTAVTGLDPVGRQLVETNSVDALSFDFGIIYHTGFKSLDFGMNVRNFSTEIRYDEDGFQLPLTFKIGVSMNMLDILEVDKEMHSFLLAVDAAHPRDYPEQISIGGEYTFMNTFSMRAGYTSPTDEQEFSAGVGFKQKFTDFKFAVDYSYTPFGIFQDVHRVSINIGY